METAIALIDDKERVVRIDHRIGESVVVTIWDGTRWGAIRLVPAKLIKVAKPAPPDAPPVRGLLNRPH